MIYIYIWYMFYGWRLSLDPLCMNLPIKHAFHSYSMLNYKKVNHDDKRNISGMNG
jgi:hypothetical protein